ncbi:esterase/lipase family protein [Rubritalea sp.]|uniref:esterase/lipase family protein n=1 Tax=Rubritalea sp. TaxID=2109375 RepID=UPI003EFA1307
MRSLFLLVLSLVLHATNVCAKEGVILLHGLCRTSASMSKMERALTESGYSVLNVGYFSRTAPINELANNAIGSAIASDEMKGCARIHFVTHSLGGILVRSYFSEHKEPRLGRVVMLAPPNQGSEVIDKIGSWKIVKKLNGPAGSELTTEADSTPNRLGKITFECGVITGDRSINWINSLIIPGKDDGKVSVTRTMFLGVKEHRVFHVTHPYIMKNNKVIYETVHFLKLGHFSR